MSEPTPTGWPRRIWVPTMVLAGVYLVSSFMAAIAALTGGDADAASVVLRYMIAPVLLAVAAWAAAAVLALGWTGDARGRAGNLWMLGLILVLLGRHLIQRVADEVPEPEPDVSFPERVQAQIETWQEEDRRAAESGDVRTVETLRERIDTLQELGGDAGGETKMAGRAMAEALRTLDAPRAALDEALAAFTAAGGIDVSNVASREDVARRLALARSYRDAGRAYTGAVAGLDMAVEQTLADAGVSPEFRANVMQGFRSSPELTDRRMERRRLDDRFADLAVELFEMLDATWPGWRYDASDNTVAFDDPETGARYGGILSQMDDVNRRREALRSPDAGQPP